MRKYANVQKAVIVVMFLLFSLTTRAALTIYPQLTSIQGCQFSYTLQAKQSGTSTWYNVPLYNAVVTNQSGSNANTTVCNFSCSGAIDINITFSGTVSSAA